MWTVPMRPADRELIERAAKREGVGARAWARSLLIARATVVLLAEEEGEPDDGGE